MNKRIVLFITACCVVLYVHRFSENVDFPKLKGPYIGQKPPGVKAALFAPDLITYEAHESSTFSLDLTEMIICSMERTKYYRMIDGAWISQKALPFEYPPGTFNGLFSRLQAAGCTF